MLVRMIGNVVISEVGALMCVVLSELEKHMPCGELVGTREFLTLYLTCRITRRRYSRVQVNLKTLRFYIFRTHSWIILKKIIYNARYGKYKKI
jgi:hypothetical protein